MTTPDPSARIPSLAGAPWLTQAATQRLLGALADGGFEGRLVGGVVRNALLGLAITDIDIASTALPTDVMRLARAAGFDVVATGLDHGTVTVIANNHPFEVTTLRRDVSTDGRRATVAFTNDWTEDARRRDFTINALYCDAAGQVHDPLCGYRDIVARRVRFVGDAGQRIREDYLRILRFFRFSAQYATGPLDGEGLAACTRERYGLGGLSAERIRQEMVKLLVAPRAVSHLDAMQAHGVLSCVLPIAPRPGLLARIVAIEEGLGKDGAPGDAMLRLGAFGVDTVEDVERLAKRLRLSGGERDALGNAADAASRLERIPEPKSARRLVHRHGADDYRQLMLLSWARRLEVATDNEAWRDMARLADRWKPPQLPVTGVDVLAQGVAAGPLVGQILRAAEARWVDDDFTTERHVLLEHIARLAKQSG